MMTKVLVTFLVFFLSANALSTPIVANSCITSWDIFKATANNQRPCGNIADKETAVKNQQNYSDDIEKEAFAHIRLSKRQPSIAESLMAMFFIPGLILLWCSRFAKSNK